MMTLYADSIPKKLETVFAGLEKTSSAKAAAYEGRLVYMNRRNALECGHGSGVSRIYVH